MSIVIRPKGGLLGDNLSNVNRRGNRGRVKGSSSASEGGNGGNSELHFDGWELVVVIWEKGE